MTRACLLTLLLVLTPPVLGAGSYAPVGALARARADDMTEAAALFESGNGHFQAGMRLRGARRSRELSAALDDYFASLRLVRSRNVLYNAALVLEQLERWDDAFNYWTEYLAVTGLSDAEQTDGTTHRDALRPRVAVASITSEPAGAEVWIDRRDLAARGRTPLEIALPEGAHTVWLVRSGWLQTEGAVTTTLGTTASLALTMAAEPVRVQVLAPEGHLTLDGEAVAAGSSLAVAPGAHVLALSLEGRAPIERRFEVLPGGAPMVIDLTGAVAASERIPTEATLLHVEGRVPSRVLVDGLLVGSGVQLDVPMQEGEHEITVEPSSAPRWTGRRHFTEGERTVLRLDSHPTSGGLLAARGIFGVSALLSTLSAAGLSIGAGVMGGQYRATPNDESFGRATDFNLAADVSWGISAALGVVAIITLLADDAGTEGAFDDAAEEAE